jgi:hypothetical protein
MDEVNEPIHGLAPDKREKYREMLCMDELGGMSVVDKSEDNNESSCQFRLSIAKERIKQPIAPSLCITKRSTPIPFFGQYETAEACTVSLNPSAREFCDSCGKLLEPPSERLCSRSMIGKSDGEPLDEANAERVLAYCADYFKKRPYKSWFDKYERFLKAFDLSYYSGSVVHLDLVQWATTPSWGGLTNEVKEGLLALDLPFLKELLKKDFRYIFLNGKTTVCEVSKCLDIRLQGTHVSCDGNITSTVYFGFYKNSKVIGWSTYLQSAAIGSYANVDKLAGEVFRLTGEFYKDYNVQKRTVYYENRADNRNDQHDDPRLKKDGVTAKSGKDKTRYHFKGREYCKNRLVLAVVQEYAKEHPGISAEQLMTVFDKELQGSRGVVRCLDGLGSYADTERRFFMKDCEKIRTSTGDCVVCTQWGKPNIDNFIRKARQLKYVITEVEH